MAGRSVSVFLHANVAGFVNGMRTAAGSVGTLERRINGASAAQRRALQNTGRAASVMAVGLVGGFLLSVNAAMKFEKAMSGVKAATQAGADDMKKLSAAAIEAGKNTAFSAAEVARGQTELAKAGVSVQAILGGGLKGALDLAAAGELSVGEAAETAAVSMAQFNLSGKEVPHVADLLAAGANKALGEVHDLGYALKMGGLVANQFGISIENTVGTLAAFAQAGLIGSDSGTSFKTMLLHLAKPTQKSAALMEELGINVYDTQGEFIGITRLAGVLQSQLKHLTAEQRNAALAQIFGTDAIRGANVLYTQGSKGMQEWIDKTNDSGFAAKVAGTKMDNLAGDLKKLKGVIDSALIQGGSSATGALRGMAQAVTGTIKAYASLPGSVQGGIFAITGITGAALLGAAALVFMARTIREARIALATLGVTGPAVTAALLRVRAAMAAMFATNAALNASVLFLRTSLGATAGLLMGPWGIALAAGVAIMAIFSQSKGKAAKATAEFTAAIKSDSGALGENTRAAVANRLEQEGLLAIAQKFGISQSSVTDAVLDGGDALKQVTRILDDNIATLEKKHVSGDKETKDLAYQLIGAQQLKTALKEQNGELKASVDSTKRVAEATKESTGATQQNSGAVQQATVATSLHTEAEQELVGVLKEATKAADDMQTAFDELSKGYVEVDKAAIAYRASTLAASKASDKHRSVSDKEKSALIEVSEASKKWIVGMVGAREPSDVVVAKQRQLIAKFISLAMHMGNNRKEATDLARRFGLFAGIAETTKASVSGFIGKVQAAAAAQSRLAVRTGEGASASNRYKASVQSNLPVLYALAGRNQAARAEVDRLAASAGIVSGKMNTTKKAFFAAADSMHLSKERATGLWKELQKIKNKSVSVKVTATGGWSAASVGLVGGAATVSKRAKGGPIPSVGPESSRAYDSVPALLRVDEHVWTPEEVDAAGGHGAIYRLRAAALGGRLRGFATGGPVSLSSGQSLSGVFAPINTGYKAMVGSIAEVFAAAWKKAMSGGGIVAAARSMIGYPYSWGGGGSGGPSLGIERGANTFGFDCSGLTEYAWSKGRGIYIGGVTGEQIARSHSIGAPRPGALGFPHPGHVVIASGSGTIIQAPFTGSHVQEVGISRSYDWRWPNAAGYAAGGAVTLDERQKGRHYLDSPDAQARASGLAGDPAGLVPGYASGGIVEQHTAQIARGGDMRVWAEPETGGEAYIPLASGKRQRSKAILAAVAKQFGMGLRSMADGGISDVNLGDILSSWSTEVAPASWADVTDARAGKKTQAGQVTTAQRALAKAQQTRLDRIHAAEKRLARAKASTGKGRAGRIEDAQEALTKARRTDTLTSATAKLKKEREDLAAATKKLSETEKRYEFSKQSPATQLGSALGLSIKNKGAFIKNLTTLSDRGFGVFARQLLSMGGTEAEKIAADAVKMPNAKLTTLQNQVNTASNQQKMLDDLPNILTVRSAAQTLGSASSSWKAMLNATGLDPGSLAQAVHLSAGDLGKTSAGNALLADMQAHGYASGGWIGGITGRDRNLIGASAGEYMVRQRQAAKYGPLIEAINNDQVGNAMLRRYISGGGAGSRGVRGGDGASAPAINQTFNHPEMDVPQLAREAAREAAWMLS